MTSTLQKSMTRGCVCFVAAMTMSQMVADDARHKFAGFYQKACTPNAFTFRAIRVVDQAEHWSTVFHLQGRISGSFYELQTLAVQYRDQPVDLEVERQRDVAFEDFPNVVKNSEYESEIKLAPNDQLLIHRTSAYSRDGVRSPMPELFALIGDALTGRTFQDMLNDPQVEFVEFELKNWQGASAYRLRVHFQDRTVSSPTPVDWVADYYFSPESRFCVGQQQWIASDDAGTLILDYEESSLSQLLVVPVVRIKKTSRSLNFTTEILALDECDPVDESYFKISNYGFPEPPTSDNNGTRKRLLWFGLGAVAVSYGTWIYLRKRQAINN